MKFEWDEEKNRKNTACHHICFEDAVSVFNDLYRIEFYDDRFCYGEDRFIVIGMAGDILCVVYTERGDRTRIISARRATLRERREYYDRKKGY